MIGFRCNLHIGFYDLSIETSQDIGIYHLFKSLCICLIIFIHRRPSVLMLSRLLPPFLSCPLGLQERALYLAACADPWSNALQRNQRLLILCSHFSEALLEEQSANEALLVFDGQMVGFFAAQLLPSKLGRQQRL